MRRLISIGSEILVAVSVTLGIAGNLRAASDLVYPTPNQSYNAFIFRLASSGALNRDRIGEHTVSLQDFADSDPVWDIDRRTAEWLSTDAVLARDGDWLEAGFMLYPRIGVSLNFFEEPAASDFIPEPLSSPEASDGSSANDRVERQNSLGMVRTDAPQLMAHLGLWAEMWERLSVVVQTRSVGQTLAENFKVFEAAVRLRLWKLELSYGRPQFWWGQPAHSALLISTHAPPFEVASISTHTPFELPWKTGNVGGTFFFSKLDDPDRVVPNPNLLGLRISYRPVEYLEAAATRTVMIGGEGRDIDWGLSEIWDLVLARGENDATGDDSNGNQIASVEGCLYFDWLNQFLPWLKGGRFYFEYGGDDALVKGLPSALGQAGGGSLLFEWFEAAFEYVENNDDSALWYSHSIYQSGYTYRGWVLGHHMGGDGEDWYGRITFPIQDGALLQFDYEQIRKGFRDRPLKTLERFGFEILAFYRPNSVVTVRADYWKGEIDSRFPGDGDFSVDLAVTLPY
jgi:hypothetical protein